MFIRSSANKYLCQANTTICNPNLNDIEFRSPASAGTNCRWNQLASGYWQNNDSGQYLVYNNTCFGTSLTLRSPNQPLTNTVSSDGTIQFSINGVSFCDANASDCTFSLVNPFTDKVADFSNMNPNPKDTSNVVRNLSGNMSYFDINDIGANMIPGATLGTTNLNLVLPPGSNTSKISFGGITYPFETNIQTQFPNVSYRVIDQNKTPTSTVNQMMRTGVVVNPDSSDNGSSSNSSSGSDSSGSSSNGSSSNGSSSNGSNGSSSNGSSSGGSSSNGGSCGVCNADAIEGLVNATLIGNARVQAIESQKSSSLGWMFFFIGLGLFILLMVVIAIALSMRSKSTTTTTKKNK